MPYLLLYALAITVITGPAAAAYIAPSSDVAIDGRWWAHPEGTPNSQCVAEDDTSYLQLGEANCSWDVWAHDTYGVSLSALGTYNRVQMYTVVRPSGVGGAPTFCYRLYPQFTDWNGLCRTTQIWPGSAWSGGPEWKEIAGPVFEFKSGPQATTPSAWNLSATGALDGHYIDLVGRRYMGGGLYVDLVRVNLWNGASSPEPEVYVTIKPDVDVDTEWSPHGLPTNAACVSDTNGISDTTTYVAASGPAGYKTDHYQAVIGGVPGTHYKRLQMLAVLQKNTLGGWADFIAAYTFPEPEFGPSKAECPAVDPWPVTTCQPDLKVHLTAPSHAWVLYRGPIVHLDRDSPDEDGWDPSESGVDIYIKGKTDPGRTLCCDEVWLKVWNP